ncbi:hypothetical protein OHA79_19310 [Streptomyces sp. NBC_00841]|uniref:hypothetical protein n=1 Tax=Streptomyces sp. NBC_00841 TaxID=2975847 RepID=UPI002DD9530E|nr:hypothetical protein [Streptomyces sp. NBC_00841]WRZ99805.1 hypothetical protein OHA79_19310 [Streptomyces sp. NBC_00841]
MTSEANTQGTVDATTALLQAELPRLEEHQQALEKELATVTERLESVRTALTALQALSTAPPAPAPALVGNEPGAVPAPSANAETETENVAAPKIPRQAQGRTDSAVEAEAPQEKAAATPARRTARKAPVAKGRKQAPAKQKSEPAKKAVAAKAAKPAKVAEPAKAVKPAKAKAPKKAAPAAPAVDDSGSLTEMAMKVLATFGDTPVRARDVTKALGRELTPGSINTVRSTLDRLVGTSRAHRAGRGLYQAPAN